MKSVTIKNELLFKIKQWKRQLLIDQHNLKKASELMEIAFSKVLLSQKTLDKLERRD